MITISEDEQGLIFTPTDHIASFSDAGARRTRLIHADGSMSFQPGTTNQLNPRWLRHEGDYWVDPAGFRYPYTPLPEPPAQQPAPALPGLPCHQDHIISLRARGTGSVWRTDKGEIETSLTAVQAARLHPDLFLVQRGHYANRRRLRRCRRDETRHALVMDDGSELLVSHKNHFQTAQRLGLPHFYYLEPHQPVFASLQIRDFPFHFALANKAQLKAQRFASARSLIANIAWQTARLRRQGTHYDSGSDYRDFYYKSIKSALYHTGFPHRWEDMLLADPERADAASLVQSVIVTLIQNQLFDFDELGFVDKKAFTRTLGDKAPHIVLVVEKDSLLNHAQSLAAEHGISSITLGGQPALQNTFYFAKELRSAIPVGTPIIVIAYVDYDPSGWIIADSFIDQLASYGYPTPAGVSEYLVRPVHFSAEELETHALPIRNEDPVTIAKNQKWLQVSGGVGGQLLGLCATKLSATVATIVLGQVLEAIGGPDLMPESPTVAIHRASGREL